MVKVQTQSVDTTIAIQQTTESEPVTDGIDIDDKNNAHSIGGFDCPIGPMWIFRGLLYIATPQGLELRQPAGGLQVGFIRFDHRPQIRSPERLPS